MTNERDAPQSASWLQMSGGEGWCSRLAGAVADTDGRKRLRGVERLDGRGGAHVMTGVNNAQASNNNLRFKDINLQPDTLVNGQSVALNVAVTRARDELYLVVPQIYRNRGGNMIMMKPSRFLTELANELTEPLELDEGLPHLITGSDHNLLPPSQEA